MLHQAPSLVLCHLLLQSCSVKGLEQLKGAKQVLRYAHHRAEVVEFCAREATILIRVSSSTSSSSYSRREVLTSAVIRRTENCHQRPLVPELVPILNNHMCPTDQVKVVLRQELLNHCLAEAVADPTLVVLPVERRVRGIAPEQVVEQAVVGHVGRALDAPDVVHVGQRGGEAAMHAEDLGGYYGRDGESVEDVDESLPDLDVHAAFAFVVEAINWADANGERSVKASENGIAEA